MAICHCFACQRRTGSVFSTNARFLRQQVRPEGEATRYERVGDTGKTVEMYFCPACGTTLYWEFPSLPEYRMVAVGAFADPTFPAPHIAVYEDRQHPWVATADGTIQEHWN